MKKAITLEELTTICNILDYDYGNLYDDDTIIGHFFEGYIQLYTYEIDQNDIDWNKSVHQSTSTL